LVNAPGGGFRRLAYLHGFSMFFNKIAHSAKTLDKSEKVGFLYILQMSGLEVKMGFLQGSLVNERLNG